jgi:hypothetical protein
MFYDIYLLTNSVEDQAALKKMRASNDRYHESLLKKKGIQKTQGRNEDYILFDDIKDSLTGYARIVSYSSNNSDP